MSVLGDADVRRALAVMAHPDDIDFAAAGTVATWTDKGMPHGNIGQRSSAS